MPHYISSINRVKFLFIKNNLVKIQLHRSGKLILIQQLWHYGLNINNINENLNSKSSTTWFINNTQQWKTKQNISIPLRIRATLRRCTRESTHISS